MKKVVVGIFSRMRNGESEYLLISSKTDFGKFTGFFYPPGGHVEEGEDDKLALEREIEEELGIDIDVVGKLAETNGDVTDQITSWWKCVANSFDFNIQEEEISELKWMTRDEILKSETVWPATKKFFLEYI